MMRDFYSLICQLSVRLYTLGALVITLSTTVCSAADAQTVTVSFWGTLGTNEYDYYGIFGSPGGYLNGLPFSATVTYNPSLFDGGGNSSITGASTITVTINGITQSLITNTQPIGVNTSRITFQDNGVFIGSIDQYPPQGAQGLDFQYYGQSISSITSLSPPAVGSPVTFWATLLAYPGSFGYYGEGFSGSVSGSTTTGGLSVISPFLLGLNDLKTIDVSALIPNIPSTANATGLAVDGTSAAIVVFQTNTQADVTLTTNNGTSLLSYNPKFLQHVPASGQPSLIISAKDLIPVGSLFYAIALVQGPSDTTSFSFNNPAVVTAQQAGLPIQQVPIALVPPPVLFVHGILGSVSSLRYTESFLQATAPWNLPLLKSVPDYLLPITYANNAAYDDFNNKAVTGKLASSAASVLADANQAGIIAGRVDLVAHSMGGLVARAYASTPSYYTINSRYQGAVHQIITLDTPEIGSDLATFLITDGGDSLLGRLVGACRPGELLKVCDKVLHLPILGQAISLQPSYIASLTNFASPTLNIAPYTGSAIWHAVAAIAPSNSALEFVLDELTNLVSPGTTINSIFNTTSHDVAVTQASQLAGASAEASSSVILQGLSHTSAGDLGKSLKYLGYDDANVTESGLVNQYIACWLAAGVNTCPSTQTVIANSGQPGAIPQHPLMISNSIGATGPVTVKIGKPFSVDIRRSGVIAVFASQTDMYGHVVEAEALPLTRINSAYYRAYVTPSLLGKVQFLVSAAYQGHAISADLIKKTVKIDSVTTPKLRADRYLNRLTLERSVGPYTLEPVAVFPGLARPVPVSGIVSYKSLPGSAGITVGAGGELNAATDGTGTIDVRLGKIHALLTVQAVH